MSDIRVDARKDIGVMSNYDTLDLARLGVTIFVHRSSQTPSFHLERDLHGLAFDPVP